jgi:hypothetical protein
MMETARLAEEIEGCSPRPWAHVELLETLTLARGVCVGLSPDGGVVIWTQKGPVATVYNPFDDSEWSGLPVDSRQRARVQERVRRAFSRRMR